MPVWATAIASQKRNPGNAVMSTGPTDARFQAATTTNRATPAHDKVWMVAHTDA